MHNKTCGGCGSCMTGGTRISGERRSKRVSKRARKSTKRRRPLGKKQFGCKKRSERRCSKQRGGASFGDVPSLNTVNAQNVTYSLNDYNNDPQNGLSSARNDPTSAFTGGRRMKKVKGGGLVDYITGVTNSSPVVNFGTIPGSSVITNLISGNPITSNSAHIQPASSMYNSGNRPVV